MHAALSASEASRTEVLPDLPSTLDRGIAHRAAIGLIVLSIDQTMEHEFRQVVRQEGVTLYHSRIACDPVITAESLRAMGPRIAEAAALLLPGLPMEVIAYGCTAAAMELGEEAVFAEIRKARPEVRCTTPVTAAFAAFRALGARRIGVVTPYGPEVNSNVAAYLSGHGAAVPAIASFNRPDDREAARVSPEAIAEGVAAMAARPDIDAVFVSCTSLRLAEAADGIEARTGKPVTSSNHALAWHCLRLAGIGEPLHGLGRLYRLGLAD